MRISDWSSDVCSSDLHAAVKPVETLFVVDSMTGQGAANTAKAFGEALPLPGVVLTKTHDDARGGAALSVRYITGKTIKFLGTGQKVDGLDVLHSDRLHRRIRDMGEAQSLAQPVEHTVDQDNHMNQARSGPTGGKSANHDNQH